nr:BMC domain-containing protein [Alkaliphilus serpentinus]
MKSIGFLEFNSIARGIEATDTMIKAAAVDLIFSKPTCPGKFITLIAGDVAAIKASMEAGRACGSIYVVDYLVIPRVDPQVIYAINGVAPVENFNALGILEFFSVVGAVTAADAAVKAAEVNLIEVRLGVGIGGKSFVTLTGDVSGVEAAVEAGAANGIDNGLLVNKAVISSPRKELYDNLL